MRIYRTFLFVLGVLLAVPLILNAEGTIQIYHQAPAAAVQGKTLSLTFSVPGVNPHEVQRAVLYYKFSGDIAYRQKEATLNFSDFTVSLNVPENADGSVEYYFKIYFNNKEPKTWPLNYKITGPVQVKIIPPRKNLITNGQQFPVDYTILSPQPGETITTKDALIAITLFYDEADIDTSQVSFRLFLDGNDITDEADASRYFFSYVPEQLAPGTHTISLKLIAASSTKKIASWQFISQNTSVGNNIPAEPPDTRFSKIGTIELYARNQVISGNTNNVLSGDVHISVGGDYIRYNIYGTLTSEREKRLQPQNRYGFEIYAGNWLELQVGHIYPFLSPLTITGKRLLGVNTTLHFFERFLNVEFLYGNMRRSIPNLYAPIRREVKNFNGSAVDTTYFLNFVSNGRGTFQREVIGGRLSIGRGKTFRFGINLLKIQDDTTSIHVVRNYNDVVNFFPSITKGLSQADRQNLAGNSQLLTVNGNPTPKGNVVASTNLMLSLDDNHIRFDANVGASLLNNDIRGGVLDSQTAEERGYILDREAANWFDKLSWLIIINENMDALPLKLESGDRVNLYVPSGIFAGQSELSIRYFEHRLNIQYQWIGPYFESLGNSTIRNDIAGFTISDHFNLLDNQIFITLGFESLRDNLVGSEDATTNTTAWRGNVSWYPQNPNLPRISVNVTYRNRDNSVGVFNPYVNASFKKAAVLNYKIIKSKNVIAPRPRKEHNVQFNVSLSHEFNLFGINNTARFNYSLLNTTDEVFAYGDTRSNAFSFNVINRYGKLPLQTTIGVSYNFTETLSGLGKIDIFGINVGGSVFLLDEKLNIDVGVAFAQNDTQIASLIVNDNGTVLVGDDYYEAGISTSTESRAYIFSASARYNINPRHAIQLYSRITNVTGTDADIPNDRLLQIRYIFSF